MTTAQFIAKTYNTVNDKWNNNNGWERRCSSVFTDKQGTVYSYGYHYPLAFHVNGLDFVNTAGYSNTTAKHINWAWQAVGYDAVAVKLGRAEAQVISASYSTADQKLEAVLNALVKERDQLREQMDAKKRKDTSVYSNLDYQYNKVVTAYHRVRASL